LRYAVVRFGELLRDRLNFGGDFAQEIKEERATIEKVLDIQQRRSKA
jgi:hypothetical protein